MSTARSVVRPSPPRMKSVFDMSLDECEMSIENGLVLQPANRESQISKTWIESESRERLQSWCYVIQVLDWQAVGELGGCVAVDTVQVVSKRTSMTYLLCRVHPCDEGTACHTHSVLRRQACIT
jgi:hypothetical protein